MTVLVTGGAGYIGSHMALGLLDRGETVVVLDTLERGYRELVPDGAIFARGDAGDPNAVTQVIRQHNVTEIAHFAGYIRVEESVTNAELYKEKNYQVSRRLIDTATSMGVQRFIFSSTASLYGSAGLGPLSEDLECCPSNPYAQTKLDTEHYLFNASGPMRTSALRYFNVAGSDAQGRSGHVAKEATHLIKIGCQAALGQRDQVTVFGTDYPTSDGTCIRDYIHIDDLVDAHLRVLDHLRAGGMPSILNCGYGQGVSVREVLAAVQRVSGVSFDVKEGPPRTGDPASLVADISKMRLTLNWSPTPRAIDEIVKSALQWEQNGRVKP